MKFGLRKSIGAKRIHIFYQFLTESICLCLCGGVLGIAGGWVAAHGMARLAVRIVQIVPEWPVVLSLPWILTSVIFSVFMGVSFEVYPSNAGGTTFTHRRAPHRKLNENGAEISDSPGPVGSVS